MTTHRRKFIKTLLSSTVYGLTLAGNRLHSSIVHTEWVKAYFNTATFDETLLRLFGETKITESKKIKISRLPRVAENGARVPISISSTLENVEKISILVEKNPSPLSAEFFLSPVLAAHVSARLKMATNSSVVVIVQAEGKLYRTSRSVRVAIGGCGA